MRSAATECSHMWEVPPEIACLSLAYLTFPNVLTSIALGFGRNAQNPVA